MTENDVCHESMRTYLRLVACRIVKPVSPVISVSDLVQDVMVSAWRRIREGSTPESDATKGWLISILVNKLKHHRRWLTAGRRDARKSIPISIGFGSFDRRRHVSSGVTILEVSDALEFGLSKLKPDDRRVIELRLLEELDFEEAASRLDVSVGCARKRYERALKLLEEQFRIQFDT